MSDVSADIEKISEDIEILYRNIDELRRKLNNLIDLLANDNGTLEESKEIIHKEPDEFYAQEVTEA